MQASSLPPVMPHPHYYAPPPGAPLLFPCYAAVPVPVIALEPLRREGARGGRRRRRRKLRAAGRAGASLAESRDSFESLDSADSSRSARSAARAPRSSDASPPPAVTPPNEEDILKRCESDARRPRRDEFFGGSFWTS